MKKNLIIIGAGDVGKFITYNLNLFPTKFDIVGILDDDESKWGESINGCKIIGPIADLVKHIDEKLHVVIGVAEPKIKQSIIEKLGKFNLQYPTLVSKNAWISNGVKIGQGVIIYPGVSINHGSTIGDFALLNMNCAIGHDTTIGPYSFLSPGVCTGGFTELGTGVIMGINSSTNQQVTVGDHAVVGGQAMLINNVKENATVAGVPARRIDR